MSSEQRILPKGGTQYDDSSLVDGFNEDDVDASSASSSKQRRRVTVIACFQCRKRKCKCDGNQPCGNCVRRNTVCEFDTVSGSAHSEDLKGRVRSLELDLRNAVERNLFLEREMLRLNGEVRQLTATLQGNVTSGSLNYRKPEDGVENNWAPNAGIDSSPELHSVGAQHWPTQSRSGHYPLPAKSADLAPQSLGPDANYLSFADTTTSLLSNRTNPFVPPTLLETNKALENFVNHRRLALLQGEDPDIVLNSGLDVGPLIDPTSPATEWSSWALMLPSSSPDMPIFSKLACAYVTYQQLRWLIFPNQDNYNRIPDFLKPAVALLCVPHSVWINLCAGNTLGSLDVSVSNFTHGTIFTPEELPSLITSRIVEWDRPLEEATVFVPTSGHTRLTPAFEDYVRDSSNWRAIKTGLVVATKGKDRDTKMVDGV